MNGWTSKIRRKLNRCPNCDEANPHYFDRGGRCGHALTIDGKSETSNVKDMLATLMQDPESVRIFQQKLDFLWDVAYFYYRQNNLLIYHIYNKIDTLPFHLFI